MSRQAFAGKLKVSIMTVYRWESGKVIPSPLADEKLVKLNRKVNAPAIADDPPIFAAKDTTEE